MVPDKDDRLAEALALRKGGEAEAARQRLLALRSDFPDDAQIAMHTAWVHDALGLEDEAVPHYRAALALGLTGDELHDTLLGLGSTYRALGRDAESDRTLREALERFPDDPVLRVFHALTLYSLDQPREALRQVLHVLVASTADEGIRGYRHALEFYADDLDRSWLAPPRGSAPA
jgi:tetratricopeptide (TPR) repeat protein